MDDETLSMLITAAAMAAFVVSGWATFWIWRARRSGWSRLAALYGTHSRSDSMPRKWLSAQMKPSGVHYPKLLTARLTVDGLYLVPNLFCRFGHDPLLVPWNDIEIFAIETYPADRLYDLKFAKEANVRIRIGVTIAQFIRRAADNSVYFAEEHSVHAATRPVASRVAPAGAPVRETQQVA